MRPRIALKRLTASDLTFFEHHFRTIKAGNQKAINLNRNVFVDLLYPAIPDAAISRNGRFPIDLTIYGPGRKPPLNLQRKIIKLGEYKNWRLNGEFIYNPPDDPDRFNSLEPGDFAIFDFSGDLYPDAANLYLVGKNPNDIRLNQILDRFLKAGNRKMVQLHPSDLENLFSDPAIPSDHPVRNLGLDDALEDAALGGADGMEKLWRISTGRGLNQADLEKARTKASETGRQGEELIAFYLETKKGGGDLQDFKWVSDINAVSPYDFELLMSDGSTRYMDVKTTTGSFERKLHISLNELRCMAGQEQAYDLYRVYDLEKEQVRLRISRDLNAFAATVMKVFEGLPDGILPDGISVEPGSLDFGEEVLIPSITEPEDE